DTKGCVVGILGTAEDITERKQAEDKLHQAHIELHQFKTTLDITLDSVLMFDAETLKFFYVNQGAINQLGYSQQELLQMTLFDLDAQVSVEGHYVVSVASYKLAPVQRYETQHRHKNGQLVAVEVFIQYISIEKQKDRFVAIVRDITERKHTEEKLRHAKEAAEVANRAKSTFVANMSHELRTPLNGILGYTQILIRDKSLTEKQKQGIEIINRSGEHLLMLINDILDLSKIEAGKLDVVAHDFCLPEFLENIIELIKMRAEQKNISFKYKTLNNLPIGVHADEKRLRQILLNLLSNAIKFTDQGGVCFRVRYQHNMMCCEIEDTGSGISESELEAIFMPFQQVGDKSRHMEGTGLGLFISQRLVTMMGGCLNVNSTLNQGSCFWFEIPMIEVPYFNHHRPSQPIISGYRSTHQLPFKILVVDDSQPNRAVLVNLLSELGFELAEATNGLEALERAHHLLPDLILMDLVMPIMDGFELARQLRQAEPPLNQVIIIANSASVFDFHQSDSLAAGCNAFLAKPIRAEALLALLQQHLPLEWINEEPTLVPAETQDPVENFNNLLRPSAAQTEALLRRVMSGNIRKIMAQIDQLEQENPQLSAFCQIARQLIKNFEMNKLKKFLQADPIGDSDT
ncbi:MAG: ATP-binding protein, partial [Pseudomonadota bacterium]|nr:ATP-binding protein [Pseudomonadota bacterium]